MRTWGLHWKLFIFVTHNALCVTNASSMFDYVKKKFTMYPRFDYGQCEDENFPPREEIPAKPSHTAGPQRGYFAFPLGWSSRFYIIEREVNRIKARRAAEAALSDDRTNEEEQQMRQCVLVEQTPRNEEATRRKRQHEELARQGEMEWVR